MTRGKILKKYLSKRGKVLLKSVFTIERQNQSSLEKYLFKEEWI